MARPIAENLLKWFKDGLNIEKFHLVGHSLGGQLAGMVGKNIKSGSSGDVKLRR